jgi:uncharacterized repeat protein (TIGR03803 family)
MKKIYFLTATLFCLGIGTGKAQYTLLHSFNGTDGEQPRGSLTLSGNKLYGMTLEGGVNDSGNIFSIDTTGLGFTDLFSFNGANGMQPAGNLTISGGKLYGMTEFGGAYHNGCVFSIDTNGNGYKDLLDFNVTNGGRPGGSLTLLGGVLYGMTGLGGAHRYGCIFSLDTNGSNYIDLHDFNGTDGRGPTGSLTFSNGKFYGMTADGGANFYGIIFSIDTNGNGYKDLFDFGGTSNGNSPYGDLTISGGKLYGMTNEGGATSIGNIFSIDTNGNGYKDLLDFDNTNGQWPDGDLTYSGGVLYGMVSEGGSIDVGRIFSIDTSGNSYTDILDFGGVNNPEGSYPFGNLTLSGQTFFGMAEDGGTYNYGVVFKLLDGSVSTGINKINREVAISLYPNPSTGIFTISFAGAQNFVPATMEIYNVLGQKVFVETLNPPAGGQGDNLINLTGEPGGVYLYRIITHDGSLVGEGKVIIQK